MSNEIKEIYVAEGGGKPAYKVNLVPPKATDVQAGVTKLSDAIDGLSDAATGQTAATPLAVSTVNAKIGTLGKLTTEEKTDLVSAINEVNSNTGGDFSYTVTPTITSPVEGTTDVFLLITVEATGYLSVFPTDLRAYREFQIALDPKFKSVVQKTQVDADSWEVPLPLATSTKHYVRVRDMSQRGFASKWAGPISFTTRTEPIHVETPIITLKGYHDSPTDIGSGVDIAGSAFAISDGQKDEHVSTSWTISDASESPIWQSLDDTTNKEKITVPNGTFQKSTSYVLTVVYKSKKFGDSAPAVVEFTTSNDFGVVNAPTLEVEGAPSSVYETPLLTGGVFSNTREPDVHVATDWAIIDRSSGLPAWQELNDSVHLTSITVESGLLEVSKAYTAMVRYKGRTFGWSNWTEVQFSTVDIFQVVQTPTISGTAVDYDPQMEFTGSPFTIEIGPQSTHDATDWVFYSTEGGEQEIFASRNDRSNLTSTPPYTLNSHIQQGKEYVLKARYHSSSGAWSGWGEFRFTTTSKEFTDPIVGPFVGTKGIHFIGTVSDPNENFFEKATIYKPEAYLFRVYINGELDPQQNIYSLTYPDNAEVLIESIDKKTKFPWFNAENKNFIRRFLEPLPALYRTTDELVLDYTKTLFDAYALTEIPEYFLGNIWQQNGNAVKFNSFFESCTALTKIPENLFSKTAFVGAGGEVTFIATFKRCEKITAIPANLFRYVRNVTSFSNCFSNCSGLTTIPENLFANNTAATGFSNCFQGCSGLTTIPENLFANNTAAMYFNYCFELCSDLTTIPENLFANNTAVTGFSNGFNFCFSHCSGLTAIPENLFANNTAATGFSHCFYNCSGLIAIPENLFANNTAATDFSHCFYNCSGLTVRVRIGSRVVNDANDFAYKSKSKGTVYVPRGSKTATTFRNANYANVNVIEE